MRRRRPARGFDISVEHSAYEQFEEVQTDRQFRKFWEMARSFHDRLRIQIVKSAKMPSNKLILRFFLGRPPAATRADYPTEAIRAYKSLCVNPTKTVKSWVYLKKQHEISYDFCSQWVNN